MDVIKIFSLMSLLDLYRIRSAVPLLDRRPPINADIDIALFKYSSVKMTLAPQFGINPIRQVTNGPKMLSFNNIFDK